MKVLVTGGAGYIGSHTAKALALAGFKPVVLDSLVYGHKWAAKWGPLEEGDLSDTVFVRKVLSKHSIQAVIHFAAYAYVGESVSNPRKYFHNNVVNTLQLLDAMVDANIQPIVFSSSCATYGVPQKLPLEENHPQQPINPYGETKLFSERIMHWYDSAYALRYAALRYFNAAGADPDGELGEDHTPETHLIPLVLDAALGKIPQVQIFGTDYDTADGTAIRDYIHVTDLASAHVKALQHLLDGKPSLAVNLGTGKGHSVREIIAAVERITGQKVPAKEAPRRAGDPPVLVADARKAGSLLNWQPQYADIDTIVQHAYNWLQKQGVRA